MLVSVDLIDGVPEDPVLARDSEGVTYHFGYDGEIGPERARLLDFATRIARLKERVFATLTPFLHNEWLQTLGHDDGPAALRSFTIAYTADREVRVFAYLDQAEPDMDDLLYGFWEVELDADSLQPIAYNGVVPAIPHYCLGSGDES